MKNCDSRPQLIIDQASKWLWGYHRPDQRRNSYNENRLKLNLIFDRDIQIQMISPILKLNFSRQKKTQKTSETG